MVRDWVGTGRAIPVPSPASSQGPIFNIFKAKGPTHGQMKAILDPSTRFPEMGLEYDQN